MPKTPPTADEFISSGPLAYSGLQKCQTCLAYGEDILSEIEKFAAARRDGDERAIRQSWSMFMDVVLKPRGYELTKNALRNHVKRCVGYGWTDHGGV